jgi:hypothetical protein
MVMAICATGANAQWGPWGQPWQPGQWVGPQIIQGAYGFTGTAACLVAPGGPAPAPTPGNTAPLANAGFNSMLQPVDPNDSFSVSFAVEGIRMFNGIDPRTGIGSGTVKGTAVGISIRPTPNTPPYPNFAPSADKETFTYAFQYSLGGDGSWSSTMVPGSYSGSFVSGPRTGQTDTNTIPPITGLISIDGNTLTGATDMAPGTNPTVETVTYSNGDVWPRICHRSRIFINLPGFSNFPGGK